MEKSKECKLGHGNRGSWGEGTDHDLELREWCPRSCRMSVLRRERSAASNGDRSGQMRTETELDLSM
jgi:hypothetical protein